MEIEQLRGLLIAKESSLDSLRETLATTQQSSQTKFERIQKQLERANAEVEICA